MSRSILPNCKPKVTSDIMERNEDDKLVLYRGHHLFVMNIFAAEIWQLCDGSHTIDDMVNIVNTKYNVSKGHATQKITSLITRLAEHNLIRLQKH